MNIFQYFQFLFPAFPAVKCVTGIDKAVHVDTSCDHKRHEGENGGIDGISDMESHKNHGSNEIGKSDHDPNEGKIADTESHVPVRTLKTGHRDCGVCTERQQK
jgi:hypothetical protein